MGLPLWGQLHRGDHHLPPSQPWGWAEASPLLHLQPASVGPSHTTPLGQGVSSSQDTCTWPLCPPWSTGGRPFDEEKGASPSSLFEQLLCYDDKQQLPGAQV